MNSWMKRRIDRSRARCQKAAEQKETMRREKKETGRNKQKATSPRELSHTSSDK
jgi:hypothetical protein